MVAPYDHKGGEADCAERLNKSEGLNGQADPVQPMEVRGWRGELAPTAIVISYEPNIGSN